MRNKNDIKKKLETAFGDDESNKYYVYMLCDEKNNVFYVGKGTGARILAHEKELEKEEKEIAGLRDDEEKELRYQEFGKKKAKIKEIGEEKVKKIIIKYGLTEQEAFMAESALINALKYMSGDLCNIANGHASALEKGSKATIKTKARELRDFLNDCAPEALSVNDIEAKILKQSIFISINKLAPVCNNDRDLLWDAVRGEWRMDKNKANNARYVFAMNNSIIKAVFEVEPKNVKDVLSKDNKMIPNRPNSGTIHRDKDYELAQRIAEICNKYDYDNSINKPDIINIISKDPECIKLGTTTFNTKDKEKVKQALRKWIDRRYFTARKTENEEQNNEKYANKILIDKSGEYYKSPQNSVKHGSKFLEELK